MDNSTKISNSRPPTKIHSSYPGRNPKEARLAIAVKMEHIDQYNLDERTTEACESCQQKTCRSNLFEQTAFNLLAISSPDQAAAKLEALNLVLSAMLQRDLILAYTLLCRDKPCVVASKTAH